MTVLRLGILLCATASLNAGCDNRCQAMCAQLADYRDECGDPASDAEVDACYDVYRNPSSEDLQTCAVYSDPVLIRREWTCDELNLWRGGPGRGGGGDADASGDGDAGDATDD